MIRSDEGQPAVALRRLGFSDLEAATYVDLLMNPGSTGYRIGRSINKPHANVYQALISLEQKGAVLFEEGETRTYTAVPPAELIANLRQKYERECLDTERALGGLQIRAADEDRFFRLTNREQVFARARALLREANETILLEAHPGPARELRESLLEAKDRGLAIAGVVFSQEDVIEGTKVSVSQVADKLLDRWTGEQLTLVIDGREFLLAFLKRDSGEVIHALWVNSPYVAMIFHNAMASDVLLHGLEVAKDIGSVNHALFGQQPPTCGEVMAEGQAAGERPRVNGLGEREPS